MAVRIVQVITEERLGKSLESILKKLDVIDWWKAFDEEGRTAYSMLIQLENTQSILDLLQTTYGTNAATRILVLPVEASLPKPVEKNHDEKEKEKKLISTPSGGISREELYDHIVDGTKLNRNYILLVLLSTIVAATGLLENNVAVLIGAMVIAPLLGPNLAMALAAALGDLRLMAKAALTNLSGLVVCFAFSYLIGTIWPYGFNSVALLQRTGVGFDGMVIALTSGAAAVLSLTTGISSVLVGVMVAVALLPPTAVIGITCGAHEYYHALGAALLLAVNLVCVNLAANLVFLLKGVRPTRWYEKQKAKTAMLWNIAFWLLALIILSLAIYFRNGLVFIG